MRYAPHYTPDLDLSDAQGAGPALMRIFAHLAETVARAAGPRAAQALRRLSRRASASSRCRRGRRERP